METTELEAQVYDALINNDELMGMLPSGGDVPIYHLLAPAGDGQRYPLLVYFPTNDVPVNYADDEEISHKVTIRIIIVTTDGQYDNLNRIVRQIMTQHLGFMRINTTPAVDWEYNKTILNCDYQKTIRA